MDNQNPILSAIVPQFRDVDGSSFGLLVKLGFLQFDNELFASLASLYEKGKTEAQPAN